MNAHTVNGFEDESELGRQQLEQITYFFEVDFVILDHEVLLIFIEACCKWLLTVDSPVSEENWQVSIVLSHPHLLSNLSHSLVVKCHKRIP